MDTDRMLGASLAEENSAEALAGASRRATLLNAAAQVSRNISSILDPNELLPRTVDIICDEYGFYYAGIFLIETSGRRETLGGAQSRARQSWPDYDRE